MTTTQEDIYIIANTGIHVHYAKCIFEYDFQIKEERYPSFMIAEATSTSLSTRYAANIACTASMIA